MVPSSQPKKKLLLILPVAPEIRFFSSEADEPLNPPLALAYIAALTPPEEWDITVIDENCEIFRYREADLVGISSITQNAARAYEIATLYRQNQVPVVIGGWHASAVPEEAARYADAVVVGEAEDVWPQLLEDLRRGRVQKIYRGGRVDLEKWGGIRPRRDIFNPRHKYPMAAVQFSRGCPGQCEFCTIPAMYGAKVRYRPVEEVLDELESIREKAVFFIDDNFIGYSTAHQKQTMELLRGIVRRGIELRWFGQGSINVYQNEEMLDWMQTSGCAWMLSGLESVDRTMLEDIRKGANAALDYRHAVSTLHRRKIALLATWVVGYPGQTAREIMDILDFCLEADVDLPVPTMASVNPGSGWWDKYSESLPFKDFPRDYTKVSGMYMPWILPGSKITWPEWQEIWRTVADKLYSWPRTLKTLWRWTRQGDHYNAWILFESYMGMRKYYRRLSQLDRWVDLKTGEFRPDGSAGNPERLDAAVLGPGVTGRS